MFVTVGVWVMVIRQRECVAGAPDAASKGELASGAGQPGIGASDILCHRLYSVDNFEKLINFFRGSVSCFFQGFFHLHFGEVVKKKK